MILGGGAQSYFYRKYATKLDETQLSASSLYRIQILLTLVMSLEPIVNLALQGTVIRDHTIHGYQVYPRLYLGLSRLK